MKILKRLLQQIWNIFNIITDWFLIIVGAVLVTKAFLTIDVTSARYIVVVVGVLFFGIGLWFRRRRMRQRR